MFLQRSLSRFAVERPDFCRCYVPYATPCLSYRQTEKAKPSDSDKPLEPIEKEIHINLPQPPSEDIVALSYHALVLCQLSYIIPRFTIMRG